MSDTHAIIAEQGSARGFRADGGGWPVQPWVPCFSGSGATLEVHFLDADGSEIAVHTYTLSSTPVGAYGLTRTNSSFLADRPKNAVGFRAYARDADVSVGRGGTVNALSSGTYCDPAATLPDTLYEDWSFDWCIVGGSDGWRAGAIEQATLILQQLLQSASALDTNIVKHNGTEYQVTRVGGALTATGSLVPATSAKYGVLLYLLLIPEDGVDDTFRLSDSGGDLLGTSAVPIPLSSDGGAAGASGFGFNFPYGIKTTGVNRAITITFGGAGTFAYYAVYALTTD